MPPPSPRAFPFRVEHPVDHPCLRFAGLRREADVRPTVSYGDVETRTRTTVRDRERLRPDDVAREERDGCNRSARRSL